MRSCAMAWPDAVSASVPPVTTREAAYGTWPTPITSEAVVTKDVSLWEVMSDGDQVIWSEGRPEEEGRVVLVGCSPDGERRDLIPGGHNARTAVHEYGGGAWWPGRGILWYANWSDQRLYRLDTGSGSSQPLTPAPEIPRGDRYADGRLSPDGQSIVCVREHHPVGATSAVDVRNEIIRLDAHAPSEPEVLVSGPDFVSDPRLSPDGESLCWIEWDHPHMPWDETRLRIRNLASGAETIVAGEREESVQGPQWQADGSLTFISDRSGWWNLYRYSPAAQRVEPLVEVEAEIGVPQWLFGFSRYAVLARGLVVFAQTRRGFDSVAVRLPDGTLRDLGLPYTSVRCLRGLGADSVVVVGGSGEEETSVARIQLTEAGEPAEYRTLRPARKLDDLGVAPELISVPEAVELASAGGRHTHALLYRPLNPGFRAPEGELAPLLIDVHGGPTGAALPELQLEVQYFTSRGFAVLAVNYGGSTGYGRPYRELLKGAWGVVDVEDSLAAARWAAEAGLADPKRICVRGGSAGGYTTLAALARADTPFAAGGDYFGIADLEVFARDTHKFESRYIDSLVGPYPERRDLYRERSPIEHLDQFATPLIVLQGLEDAIVPPNQATIIVDALRAKGVPVLYLPFEGEQHGFRQDANIRRALDAELSFYALILGFALPEEEGLSRWRSADLSGSGGDQLTNAGPGGDQRA